MKKLLIICSSIILLTSSFIHAQAKLIGDWEGLLDVGAKKVRILLHVKQDSSGYSTLMDSPDQGAVNIPIEKTEVFGDSIKLTDDKTKIMIFGVLRKDNDSLSAEFVQRSARIKMDLGRSAIRGFNLSRPQTPKAPFPYKIEDVIFVNKKAGNIKLAGTLTVPDNIKNPPVIITISGSGAQNRNERIFDHEPFWILADYLGRNGVAVLRFDDRGVGASEGNFRKATSHDFSTDVEAAVEFLLQRNDIDINKIGLFGHSEGGLIAPMVAARNSAVRFIITLAGPALPSDKLMIKQIQDISASENMSRDDIAKEVKLNSEVFAAIKSEKDSARLDSAIREILIRHNFGNGKIEAHASYMSRVMT
ncbi:MAG: alpha/beta hydrolase, partial [Syntrophothermus sp.]